MDPRTQQILNQVSAARREALEMIKKLDDIAGALNQDGSSDSSTEVLGVSTPVAPGREGRSGHGTKRRIGAPMRHTTTAATANSDTLKLQNSMGQLSQQIAMLSNILKTAHDTAMATIRNTRP